MTATEINVAIAQILGLMRPLNCVPENECYVDCLEAWNEEAPDFYASLDACVQLLDALRKDGWSVMMDMRKYIAWFAMAVSEVSIHAEGETLPAAICELFLRVKGGWRG